jgi:Ran GTPase-activating protein (RanGAP) involved in mRNA processing and transport
LAVAQALRVNNSLTEVNLDGFALPVKKLKGTDPVKSLDLSQKGLKVSSAVLIAALIGVNASLTSLDLNSNGIGIEGGKAVAELLRVNGSLKSLDVGFNGIGREVALELVSTFAQKKMISVGLARCDLDANAARVVAEYVRVSDSLTEVNLDGFKLPVKKLKGTEPVERLDLSGRGLGVDSAVVIASLINLNVILKSLK